MTDRARKLELLNDPEFRELSRAKNRICIILTLATLAIYFGFIFLLAFKKSVFGIRFTTHIPLGIPVGIGVIAASWVLTGVYVRWANQRYDAMVRSIRSKVENGLPADRPGPV